MPVTGDSPSPIDPARMSAIAKTLASDAFQGRAPGTPGEAATIAAVVDTFVRAIETSDFERRLKLCEDDFAKRASAGPGMRFNF